MDIFKINKIFLKISGLFMTSVAWKHYKWVPYLWILAFSAPIIPLIGYIVASRSELANLTEGYYPLVTVVQNMLKLCIFWSNIGIVKNILEELECITEERKCFKRIEEKRHIFQQHSISLGRNEPILEMDLQAN